VCAAILGTENVNMVEMATVFSTFSRQGVRVDPVMVTEIINNDGTSLYQHTPESSTVLSSTVASQLTWALSRVMSGTGWRAALEDRPAAGKTGTAQNNADATFVGFTPQRTTAIWVGYPDEQVPMRTQFNGGKVEGGTFPALIWHELMTTAMAGFPIEEFPTPPPSSTTTTLPEIPEEAEVPSLIGRVIDEALLLELEEGFWILESVEIETRDHEPGAIFNQVPAALSIVPGGTTITVEVAIEPEILPVPSVIGLTEAEAKQVLTSAGFGITVELVQNPAGGGDPPPVGIVWSQNPVAETPGEDVLTVTITVNPEPPPPTTTTVTVPPDEGE